MTDRPPTQPDLVSDLPSSAAIFHDPARLDGAHARPVLALGNFDGVHRGHRAVIDRTKALAEKLGRPSGTLTFAPHPRRFFAPQVPFFSLTPTPLREEILALTGIDAVVVLTFDQAMAATSAEDFVEKLLVGRLGVSGVVAGYDFHFGKGRAGSPGTLTEAGARHGFAVEIVQPFAEAGDAASEPISSSAVRAALAAGEIDRANTLLGYRWCVRETVLHGDKRGRLLGYPTANLVLDPACGLRHGIYAVRVAFDGQIHDGVASFGRRPTFDDGAPRLEVHLFDFSGDLYDKPLVVEFAGWIRGEEKFSDIEALIRRMDEDSRQARRILAEPSPVASLAVDLARF